MPHVIDDPDVLDATESDEIPLMPLTLPVSRRERSTLLASLRGWVLSLLQRHTPREQTYRQRILPEPVLSIDLLARTHPDIYRQITSWSL